MKPAEIFDCEGCGLQSAYCIAPVKLSKSPFTHLSEIVAYNLQPINYYNFYLRTYMCIGSHGDDQEVNLEFHTYHSSMN